MRCYPIGMITMKDNNADDDKIIAIPFDDPTYNEYNDISELPRHVMEEMSHFFSVYKALENKQTVIDEVKNRDEAIRVVQEAIDSYIELFCK